MTTTRSKAGKILSEMKTVDDFPNSIMSTHTDKQSNIIPASKANKANEKCKWYEKSSHNIFVNTS